VIGLTGNDGNFTFFQRLDGDVSYVEAELGFAGGFVVAVTLETLAGEDGADFAVEIDLVGGLGIEGDEEERDDSQAKC
jgi:hypothetical protein